jgi:hypothetical protein
MNLDLFRKYLTSQKFEQKLNNRIERLQRAELNPVDKTSILIDIQDDPLTFINLFGVVYEPRLPEMPDIPFFPFPYQEEVIYRILEAEARGEDLLIEKTRDMGITWTIIWYILWRWLTKDKYYALLGSRKEEEVDNKCYSDDTEVLTKDGWKLFKDVDIDKDFFATRNPITKEFEWQKATEKIKQRYSGDFYHIKSRTLDLLVSPNHRVLYRNNPWGLIRGKYESNERFSSAKELYNRGKSIKAIPSTSIWKGKEIKEFVFETKNKHQKRIVMSGDDFCAFMGMYLAEGNIDKGMFVITQSKKSKGYREYKKLLIRIFGTEPCYTGEEWKKGNIPIVNYLKQFGRSWEKFIPQEILDATPRQLSIFLYYYMLGDGSWRSAQPTVGTVSKKMADQLQEVIQKIGYSASIIKQKPKDSLIKGRFIKKENCRTLYILNIRKAKYQSFQIEKTYYDGYIYCVSVPNGVLYVRRNGKPAWCGNSPQSLFGKIRYSYYSLPKWLRPVNFRKSEHDIFLKFVNPDKQSFIDGESANPNFGRGKRTSIVYLDELFFWKFARESWRSCMDTSPVRIGVSTAYPSSFARSLRDSFEKQGKLITLDWKKHPFKDEEWYKKELERREADPLGVEGEIEISYRSDPTNAYYPEVLNCKLMELEYNPSLPLYIGVDFGVKDKTAFTYWQRDFNNFYLIDAIERNNKPLHWFYPFLKQGIDFDFKEEYEIQNKFTKEKFLLKKKDYTLNDLDFIRKFNKWKPPVMYCGEIAHKQKMIKSNSSIQSELAGLGIYLRINDKGFEHSVRRVATKKLLLNTIFNSNSGAMDAFDALANSHYPKSRDNSSTPKDAPVHDEWADLRASVENFAVNIITPSSIKEIQYKSFRK